MRTTGRLPRFPELRLGQPYGLAMCTRRRASASRSSLVLVVAAPPDARFVAPFGGTVEPRVHAPEGVQPARIGGIGVVDDTVLEGERTHPRPLARVRAHVGSGHGRVVADRITRHPSRDPLVVALLPGGLAPVVVFDAFALLLLGERGAEVEVEF